MSVCVYTFLTVLALGTVHVTKHTPKQSLHWICPRLSVNGIEEELDEYMKELDAYKKEIGKFSKTAKGESSEGALPSDLKEQIEDFLPVSIHN